MNNLHQFHLICVIKLGLFLCRWGFLEKSGWICFPVSGSVVESGLYNEDAFPYGFYIPKKGVLRRLVNPFP